MKYLKTLLTSISSAALLLAFPLVSFAAFAVGFNATSTATSFISPNLVNGVYQTIQANNFLGTSTTAASNFTLLGVGSSTPFGVLGVVGTTTIKGTLLVTRTGEVPTYNDSNLSLMDIVDNVNSYTFVGLQNKNNGVSASSDFVWGNDRTTAATYYADCGGTSSKYADAIFEILDPNDGYCFSTDGAFKIGSGTTTAAGYLGFFTGGYANANEKARITQGGSLGIGTTTPFATLAVNPVAGQAQNQFVVGSSTKTNFIVTNTGNVGIGTTTPNTQLTVSYVNAQILNLDRTGSGNGAEIRFGNTEGQIFVGMNASEGFSVGPNLDFNTASWLNITNSGNIGIGSSTPFATLSVNPVAGAASNQFVVGSSSATSFLINNTGKVGIGTTSPVKLLTVNSQTANQSTLRLDNSVASLGRIYDINSHISGVSNSGFEIYDVTGGVSRLTISSAGNIGIGTTTPQAKLSIIGGNLEIGTSSSATVGNVTIGGARLLNTYTPDIPTGASTNLFFGKNAGNYTLTGTNGQNAGFGAETLANLTTGVDNAIVGFRGGNSITSGSNNAGIGGSSCRSITTGLQNTCLGYLAGFTGQVGTVLFSTAIGTGAYTSRSNSMVLGGVAGDYADVALGTTTPWAKFSIQGAVGSTTPLFEIASSTNSSFATSTVFKVGYDGIITMSTTTDALTSLLNLGVNPTTTNGTTTVHMGKMQFEGYNSDGAIICKFVVGTTEVIQLGPCKN